MSEDFKSVRVKPRIIIHGGAGNITRQNLPTAPYQAYRAALLAVVQNVSSSLSDGATALDAACRAVEQLENNPLFNSGHGAVFTRAGTHELEASVMVSRGYRKRAVGVMGVTRAKNPIKLAKEMLIRGEADDGGGAQQHCQLHGQTCDRLAESWGLELVEPSYYWTRRRWDEHRRGLNMSHDHETYKRERGKADKEPTASRGHTERTRHGNGSGVDIMGRGDISWDGKEYLPQGTVGAVALDETGTLCVATSTGGLTNKLPGRIGDTPTIGAGFWAEQWHSTRVIPAEVAKEQHSVASLATLVSDCIPGLTGYMSLPPIPKYHTEPKIVRTVRAVAMSGTGNGDSFLRVNAVRTAAAIARYSSNVEQDRAASSLQGGVTAVAGPHGLLQQSAEDRWRKTGEGEGGIIGIELADGEGNVVANFNCGGMFRAWVDEQGRHRMAVFRDEV